MSDLPSDTDSLLLRAKGGDRAAVEILFLRHYDAVRSHLQFQLPDDLPGPINVDDVLQQAFTKAFHAIDKFEASSPTAFLAWLRTIATNQLRDVLRRHQRERKHRAARPPGIDNTEATYRVLLERLGDDSEDAPRLAMKDELLKALRVALANLPDDYRAVIRYRFIENRPMSEVATRLEKTEGAARAMCTRATKMLREELERLSRFI